MKKLIVMSLFLAACGSTTGAGGGGGSPPVINVFSASPTSISAGQSTTLSWDVQGADSISIDNGVGTVSGSSKSVSPSATTTYKMTATNSAGFTTSTVTVTVTAAVAAPTIVSFSAAPSSVATGGSVTLSWTVTTPSGGPLTALTVDPNGVNLMPDTTSGSGTHVITNVTVATDFVLKATNAGGTSQLTAHVDTHSPNLQFNYTNPSSSTAKLLLKKNTALSTNSHLVLDLVVGSQSISAFGVAFTLPFAAASSGMISFNTSTGLTVGSAINAGSSPKTAAAVLANTTAMPNTFTVGVAKHKSSAADTAPVSLPAGTVLFSIAFDFAGTPLPGTPVFDPTSLAAAGSKYRAAALNADGSEAVSKTDIAFGTLAITN